MPPTPVTATYYLEILSSWCHWAEPAWRELKSRYGDRVEFRWRIALMRPGDFPASAAHCDWFYRRSGTIVRSPVMLHSGWLEPARRGHYEAPNLVAEAARDLLPPEDDRVRLALTDAALRHGRRIGDLDTAVTVAADAAALDRATLAAAACSAAVRARVDASTATFHAHQLTQRPAFILENTIGDRAIFSGLVRAAPLAAALEALLDDAAAYASHAGHHGPPPPA